MIKMAGSVYITKDLRRPVTSIRVERSVQHDYISLFVGHALAGTITVLPSETLGFVELLTRGPLPENERKELEAK